MNYIAIVVAGFAGYAFGALWYGTLGKQWMAALGRTKDEPTPGGKMNPVPFVIAAVSNLVMAYILAGVIGHLGPGQVTVRNGLISALFVFVGFVATTLATNHAFQGSKTSLTVIDGGHWLGVLLLQGLVLGLFGV
jgi:hypothetical protein